MPVLHTFNTRYAPPAQASAVSSFLNPNANLVFDPATGETVTQAELDARTHARNLGNTATAYNGTPTGRASNQTLGQMPQSFSQSPFGKMAFGQGMGGGQSTRSFGVGGGSFSGFSNPAGRARYGRVG